MKATDWQEVIGTTGLFVLLISVALTVIWQTAATRRAKALLAREEEYRALAERAVLAQEDTVKRLAELSGGLTEAQARLRTLERILQEVE